MLMSQNGYLPAQPPALRSPPNVSSHAYYISTQLRPGFHLMRPMPAPETMADDYSAIPSSLPVQDPTHKSPGSAHAPPGLNPRSCVTCRRRKVKCDKRNPCSNCTRARIECIFPSPGRAPRKARKPPDGELMERLKKLESVVQSLGAQVDDEPSPNFNDIDDGRELAPAVPGDNSSGQPRRGEVQANGRQASNNVDGNGLESSFGRLVVNEGKTRYINGNAWANLHSEVEDLKEILNEASDEEEESYSSPGSTSSNHQHFIFGLASSNVDMFPLHPPAELLPKYWAIFKESVDPLAKILHIPTLEPKIAEAQNRLMHLPKGMEALLFAIYYGVVTSLSNVECLQILGMERDTLLSKYRFGLEQALSRAHFLDSPDLMVLQAFVLFLTLIRRNDDARLIWTLTGLAVRVAHSIGIHRDGTHFNLTPFDAEMRRRLWMQVVILDARASEDHGSDHTILEAQFDSKIPRNVNDVDLHPGMKELPESKTEFTIMTFCLIRFEISNIFRRIYYVPPNGVNSTSFYANLSLDQKVNWINDCHRRLEDTYMKHSDTNAPLFWVTTTMLRLVFSKIWLVVYHPYQRSEKGLSREVRDKLFMSSLESIECGNLLESEQRTVRWQWLFKTYVQWHCLAFMLAELCVRTQGDTVERAWRTLEQCVAGRFPNPYQETRKVHLWRPLRKLMVKARTAREHELMRERAGLQVQAQMSGIPNPVDLANGFGAPIESYPVIDALLARSGSNQWESSPTPGASGNNTSSPAAPHNTASSSHQHPDLRNSSASPRAIPLDEFTSHAVPNMSNMDWYMAPGAPGGVVAQPDPNALPPAPQPQDEVVDWTNWDDMVRQYGMPSMPVDRNGLGSVPSVGALGLPIEDRSQQAMRMQAPGVVPGVAPQGMGGGVWY